MDLEMILHSNQGSMYCSKRFNESLHLYNVIHSRYSTENGAMEAIIHKSIEDYIFYFNYERPQSDLNYLTLILFKEVNYIK